MIAILCALGLAIGGQALEKPTTPQAQFYGVSTKGEYIYKISDGTYRVGPKLPFYSAPAYTQPVCPNGRCPLQSPRSFP